MSAANVNVIDISSSSSSSLEDEEDNVPRRRSQRKRTLTDKAKETRLRLKETKAATAAAPKKAKIKRGRPPTKAKAKAANTKSKAKDDAAGGEAAAPAPAAAAEEDEEEDVCPICLDPPVLPVQLECSHKFCFTCAKGLAMEGDPGCCSLCRAPIPPGFFSRPELLQRTRSDLASTSTNDDNNNWQWFYQSRGGGWWKFEGRHNEDIETAFLAGTPRIDTLICGKIYTIDLCNRVQFAKDNPTRRRAIKRDAALARSVGVAGLVLKHGE